MADFRWLCILTCLSAAQVYWTCSAYSAVSSFVGGNLSLNCSLSGSITWTEGNAMSNVTCSSPCDYELENITCRDAGTYGCSNGTVEGEVYNVTVFPPIYPVNCGSSGGIGSRNTFVVNGENITLSCSTTNSNPSWTLSWRQDDTNATVKTEETNELNVTLEGAPELHGMNYACSAEPPANDTCNWEDVLCAVGPIFVIDEQNFLLSVSDGDVTSGGDLAFNCSTNLPDTFVRWQVVGGFMYSVLVDNDTFIMMSISTPISEQINGTVLCLMYDGHPSADPTDEIASRSMTISVRPELTTISNDLTSQQTSQEAMSSTAGTLSRGTAPSTSVEVSDGAVSVGTEATAGTTSSGSEQPTTGTASMNTTTEAPGVPKDIKLGAIIGGVVGGVVLIIIIIVIIIVFLRRPADDVEQNVKRRSKKKQNVNGSKKHRSAILSLRHKLPLFSRPYESDEEDGNDGEHVKTDNDVDTLIMDSQPRSKIASQIRVDLEIDDGGQGTIENGFVPSQLDAKTNLEGYEEGRLGITSHGTFAATNSDDPKSDETDQDVTAETNVDGDYSAVEKRNKPGDTAFGNVVYGSFSVPVHKEEKDEDKGDDAPKSNQDSLNEEQEKDLKSDDGQGEAVVKNDAAEDDALPPPPPPLFDDNVADQKPSSDSATVDNADDGDN